MVGVDVIRPNIWVLEVNQATPDFLEKCVSHCKLVVDVRTSPTFNMMRFVGTYNRTAFFRHVGKSGAHYVDACITSESDKPSLDAIVDRIRILDPKLWVSCLFLKSASNNVSLEDLRWVVDQLEISTPWERVLPQTISIAPETAGASTWVPATPLNLKRGVAGTFLLNGLMDHVLEHVSGK